MKLKDIKTHYERLEFQKPMRKNKMLKITESCTKTTHFKHKS
ncbi:hypothetical protein [Helicobacter himalayensis]|nr:hypothetical protein [Helicobacter himalayensis]